MNFDTIGSDNISYCTEINNFSCCSLNYEPRHISFQENIKIILKDGNDELILKQSDILKIIKDCRKLKEDYEKLRKDFDELKE